MKSLQGVFGYSCLIVLVCGSAIAQMSVVDDSLETAFQFDRAAFSQTRQLKALDRPLISSGTVTLTRSGFIWSQSEPFLNTLTFDGETIVESTLVGEETVTRPLVDPVTFSVTRTLYGLLSGSWEQTETAFEITREETENPAWQYRMVPKHVDIRGVIPGITVSGERYLERIVVEQSDGGVTIIELSDQQETE